MLRAGASGFISKGADSAELIRAIRTVARGNRYVGPELADMLVNGLDDRSEGPLHASLSEREFHIFCSLAQGISITEIAQRLTLSVKTVSTYRARVLEKMGFRTNADLTAQTRGDMRLAERPTGRGHPLFASPAKSRQPQPKRQHRRGRSKRRGRHILGDLQAQLSPLCRQRQFHGARAGGQRTLQHCYRQAIERQ